jgi:hypothetical protein
MRLLPSAYLSVWLPTALVDLPCVAAVLRYYIDGSITPSLEFKPGALAIYHPPKPFGSGQAPATLNLLCGLVGWALRSGAASGSLVHLETPEYYTHSWNKTLGGPAGVLNKSLPGTLKYTGGDCPAGHQLLCGMDLADSVRKTRLFAPSVY